MAQIISFAPKKPKKNVSSEAERWKALSKGNVMYFTCDDCGADIEVINEKYPDRCPGCGRIITQWDKIEENT